MVLSSVSARVNEILGKIISNHLDAFEDSGDLLVETKYGSGTFQLDEIDQTEELCLQLLVHNILLKENLYEKFLNDQQFAHLKFLSEEAPYQVYYPDPDSNEGSHDEVMEDIHSRDILEEIHHKAIVFVAEFLMDNDFEVPVLEEYLAESDEDYEG